MSQCFLIVQDGSQLSWASAQGPTWLQLRCQGAAFLSGVQALFLVHEAVDRIQFLVVVGLRPVFAC
jgi:hypothetical protein